MAIVRVARPTPTAPIDLTDYQAQIDQITALNQAFTGRNIIDESTIHAGSVMMVGGVLYKSTSDTTITGTPSRFVKITPSGATAAAAFVASLSGVAWNHAYGGYYDEAGNLHLFDEARAVNEGDISTAYTLQGQIAYLKGELDINGALTGATAISASGAVSAASVAASGAVSGATVTAHGAVSGATVSASDAVSGASAAISGAGTFGSITASGPIVGNSLSVSGDVGAAAVNVHDVNATRVTASAYIQAPSVQCSGAITGATLATTGAITGASAALSGAVSGASLAANSKFIQNIPGSGGVPNCSIPIIVGGVQYWILCSSSMSGVPTVLNTGLII